MSKVHPLSVDMSNEAVNLIYSAMEDVFPDFDRKSDEPLVIQTDSLGYDELQASDVAAGWAREMLELAEARVLGAQLEPVWVNGRRIK
jgi:hypothetical protein